MGLKEQIKLVERGKTLLNKGLTIPQISKELHIPKQRAYDLFYVTDETATKKLKEAKRERTSFIRHRDRKVWEFRGRGMLKREIADLLGISESMVRIILDSDTVRANKLTTAIVEREKEKRREKKKKAKSLRDKGWTYEQIAKEMGKSAPWVMLTLGVMKPQQRWPLDKRRKTAKEYKKLLSEGHTTQEASDIVESERSHTHTLRLELEEEERRAWKGTPKQYEKMRQKERIQFKEARKCKLQKEKEAEKEEKKQKFGDDKAVFAYCRVSTEEQAQEGRLSLDRQKEDIEKYAEKSGYRIIRWFIDPGYSGGSMDRPALQEMIEAIQEKNADGQVHGVITIHSDRLARDLFIKLSLIFEIFMKNDIILRAVTEDIDTETPEGKFMISITGAAAQYVRDRIMQTAKEISVYVWSKGHWKAPHAIPLGLKMQKDGLHLEYDEDGMRRLKKIYRLIDDNRGRVPTNPNYMNYEKIAIACGVGKNKVFRLARTTLKEYLALYEKYMGNDD